MVGAAGRFNKYGFGLSRMSIGAKIKKTRSRGFVCFCTSPLFLLLFAIPQGGGKGKKGGAWCVCHREKEGRERERRGGKKKTEVGPFSLLSSLSFLSPPLLPLPRRHLLFVFCVSASDGGGTLRLFLLLVVLGLMRRRVGWSVSRGGRKTTRRRLVLWYLGVYLTAAPRLSTTHDTSVVMRVWERGGGVGAAGGGGVPARAFVCVCSLVRSRCLRVEKGNNLN